MKKTDDMTLIAPCGIHCGACPLYKVKDDPSLRESLVKRINWNGVPCPGCRQGKGRHQLVEGTCPTYACSSARKVDFCFECAEFPCAKLNPASDRADVLPHNLKIFNLCYIKQHGVAEYLKKEPEFKQRYYQGKMVIGKGPQLE